MGIITKIKTTANLVNPSVTEEMGRVRTLTIGTRAEKVIRVDVVNKKSKCRAPNSTTIGSNKTIIRTIRYQVIKLITTRHTSNHTNKGTMKTRVDNI